MIQEEMKRDNAVLLEKLSVGNRILTVITAIEISIIIAIIMSFISKFFIG
ncbi:BDR-repeat family protein (plasmid) [Borrelia hermsii MTW]|uniref:BDR-repeat family protein n=1 Tax=Borrelia hermsii MTW TaxID=1313291 RepID=W5T572_BORHE|nr:BDR-repeat family protein [Borrelia hermsii MTW]